MLARASELFAKKLGFLSQKSSLEAAEWSEGLQGEVLQELLRRDELRLRLLSDAELLQLLPELLALGYAGMSHRRPEQASAEAAQRQDLCVLEVVTQSVFPTTSKVHETEIAFVTLQLTSSKRGKWSASCGGAQAYLPSSASPGSHRSVLGRSGTSPTRARSAALGQCSSSGSKR